MSRIIYLSAIILSGVVTALVLTLIISPPSFVFARPIQSDGPLTVDENEVYNEDLFLVGETVTFSGTVNGDLYIAAGVITVNGTVNGDLLAVGGTVAVSGMVSDDVRVAGGDVVLRDLEVRDNVSAAGGSVILEDSVLIAGSTQVGAGNISINATIERELLVGGGNVLLDGTVRDDVYLGAANFEVGPRTVLEGNLTYAADQPVDFHADARLMGEIKYHEPVFAGAFRNIDTTLTVDDFIAPFRLGFQIWSYVSALIVGILFIYFFSPHIYKVADYIIKAPWSSAGWGILVLLLTPIVIVLLMMSLVGLSLGLLLLLLYIVELYLVKVFMGLLIGHIIARQTPDKKVNRYVNFGLGLLLYYLMVAVPVFGLIVQLASYFLVLGGIFQFKRNRLLYARH